jgi:hypothetical protein
MDKEDIKRLKIAFQASILGATVVERLYKDAHAVSSVLATQAVVESELGLPSGTLGKN